MEGFLRSLRQRRPVVAMVLDAADVVAVAEHLKNTRLPREPTWLIGTLGLELRRLKSWRSVYKGGAFVEPHMPELREFKNFFLKSLKAPDQGLARLTQEYNTMKPYKPPNPTFSVLKNPLQMTIIVSIPTVPLSRYMMENTGCVSEGRGVACGSIQRNEMELRFQQDPQVFPKTFQAFFTNGQFLQYEWTKTRNCLNFIPSSIYPTHTPRKSEVLPCPPRPQNR